ncbi:ArfGap-domain-containing protein [Polychaeton citri CBS 116435]|uniref:ArfGap-domain-containing protein n=1 Tax=Polychaeton citri CBS 116435 TaxID=1314669 RepID=A0A9P4QIC9_9PEZI|nr:ArfGap-domain-containing protein [Polychaeton citri CBS 116435]
MASVISKRQQARNERALQDLIRTVPGNDTCADCAAKNPGWASWNLGIFLCMRCAALHRRLGTHISKVKSLSMDSWSPEQVDNMRKMGNNVSNRTYNPSNVQADMPVDMDEVEAAIERFIRKKYEQRALVPGGAGRSVSQRHNTGSTSTGSFNEEPPPLPPKPGKKFGFSLRSASSTFTRPKNTHFTPPLSPTFSGSDKSQEAPSPPNKSKPTQFFGMRITSIGNNFDQKLNTLKDMGFPDHRKNTEVLKSTNGNLDRAIETLIRLGEGQSSGPTSTAVGARALTPSSIASGGNGITIEKSRQPEKKVSSSPWDLLDQPQRSATLPAVQPAAVPPRAQTTSPTAMTNSWNPFLNQQQQQPLETSFASMQLSHTGPAQVQAQPSAQPMLQQNNPFTMPPSNPWQTTASFHQPQQDMYSQQPTPLAPQSTGNPFLRTSRSMTFQPTNPWMAQSQSLPVSPAASQPPTNPFGMNFTQQQAQPNAFYQPATASPAPVYGQQADFFSAPQPAQQQPPQNQQSWFDNSQTMQQQSQPWAHASQNQSQQQAWTQQASAQLQQPQQMTRNVNQQQYQQQYQPVRYDNSSILSLYNMPQLAPSRPLQTLPEDGSMPAAAPESTSFGKRSATMPVLQQPGSLNPFMQQTGNTGSRHVSNESVDFQSFNGNGRHSPDAFAGLSSRYMG